MKKKLKVKDIKKFCKEHEYTIAVFAKLCGVGLQTIYDLDKGRSSARTMRNIRSGMLLLKKL